MQVENLRGVTTFCQVLEYRSMRYSVHWKAKHEKCQRGSGWLAVKHINPGCALGVDDR